MSSKNSSMTIERPQVKSEAAPAVGKIVLEREIPSDVALVQPLVVRTVQFLRQENLFLPKDESKIALCVEEALMNAVVHGNESDFSKKVRMEIFLGDTDWGICIKDEGVGFDISTVRDPRDNEALMTESGRGIFLMAHYMDKVEYFENGRVIVMSKRL